MWFSSPSTRFVSLSKGMFIRFDIAEIRENVTSWVCTGSTSAVPPAILLVKSNIFAIIAICSSDTGFPMMAPSFSPKR